MHRYLALVLVVPLVVWSVTGLLFHLKPGWSRAYDMLDAERPLDTTDVTAVSTIASTFPDKIQRIELFGSVLGPLYRVTTDKGTQLVDAKTAQRRSPLSEDDAQKLALDAVSRSSHKSGYGEIVKAEVREDAVRIHFKGGPIVDVDRASGSLSQRGADTDRIDWLYRIHYLQWTGHKSLDRGIAVGGLALIWIVMIPGLVLFFRRWRQ